MDQSGIQLIASESIVYRALLKRLQLYAPTKAKKIEEALLLSSWGKHIMSFWENGESYNHILEALGEQIDNHVEPLVSIFSRLDITPNEPPPKIAYYEPTNWAKPISNPVFTLPTNENIHNYWIEISDAWMNWIKKAPTRSEVRLSHFLDWADLWLASIPVNNKLNTISLATHLRVMASLVIVCKEEDTFQLVLGDASGIQNYLFDIAHIGAAKVAKRLRARSFTLGLLSDGAAHRLLLDAEVPISNLIISAGGIFYAILPTSFSVQQWRNQINEHFYHRYHGSISVHVASNTVHLNELKTSFPKVLEETYQEIQKIKGTPFLNVFVDQEGWQEESFIHTQEKHFSPCVSCRKFPRENIHNNQEGFCVYCLLDEEVGQALPKTNYLLFKQGKGMIDLGNNIGVDLLEKVEHYHDGYLIQVWNQSSVESINIPIQRKWVANYIPLAPAGGSGELANEEEGPIKEGQPLTFDYIAYYGQGKDLLGYLKADVDHLGMLFSVGLLPNSDNKETFSFSHIATLSRLLERFFSGGVNEWLNEKYPLTYTVFSGGDDLFLIGPWHEIVQFSQELRARFRQFVANNTDVTLSAGIQIVKPKHPITHVATQVEEMLDVAKDKPNPIRLKYGHDFGRNQVTLIGEVMDWSDLKKILETSIRLFNWWSKGRLPSSILYKLVAYSEMYLKYKEQDDVTYLKFIPMLEYTIHRSLIEPNSQLYSHDSSFKELIDWLRNLENIDDLEVDVIWSYMRTSVKLCQYFREE